MRPIRGGCGCGRCFGVPFDGDSCDNFPIDSDEEDDCSNCRNAALDGVLFFGAFVPFFAFDAAGDLEEDEDLEEEEDLEDEDLEEEEDEALLNIAFHFSFAFAFARAFAGWGGKSVWGLTLAAEAAWAPIRAPMLLPSATPLVCPAKGVLRTADAD